jgi:hypothetical protein
MADNNMVLHRGLSVQESSDAFEKQNVNIFFKEDNNDKSIISV